MKTDDLRTYFYDSPDSVLSLCRALETMPEFSTPEALTAACKASPLTRKGQFFLIRADTERDIIVSPKAAFYCTHEEPVNGELANAPIWAYVSLPTAYETAVREAMH